MEGILNRSGLVLGDAVMQALATKRVLLIGVGGVGSWCAESLIRTGLKHLTIVDSDLVCVTNVNRQLMATSRNIGQPKVYVLRGRLQDINPDAEIEAIQGIYSQETSASFHLDQYDYIIDCIDSLKDKIDLLVEATRQPRATVFSSMGAALKLDPTRIQVTEFWKVKGCPLGSAMRSRMRHNKTFLSKKVMCVYSEERLENKGCAFDCSQCQCDCPRAQGGKEGPQIASTAKAQVNGSLSHITGIYGFTIAGLVIQHICKSVAGK